MMKTNRELLSSYTSINILAVQTPSKLTKKFSLNFAVRTCNTNKYLNILTFCHGISLSVFLKVSFMILRKSNEIKLKKIVLMKYSNTKCTK